MNSEDLKRWKELDLNTSSFWEIERDSRPESTTASGRFVYDIPYQFIQRYTEPGDLVGDFFLGSGTTAMAALELGRNCVGLEIAPEILAETKSRLTPSEHLILRQGDSTLFQHVRELMAAARSRFDRGDLDLVFLHPPYWNCIAFSEEAGDLSMKKTLPEFWDGFRQVVRHAAWALREGGHLVLVLGHLYQKGELIPLPYLAHPVMREEGLVMKASIVKNVCNNEVKGKSKNLWKYRLLKHGLFGLDHEHIDLYRKP